MDKCQTIPYTQATDKKEKVVNTRVANLRSPKKATAGPLVSLTPALVKLIFFMCVSERL